MEHNPKKLSFEEIKQTTADRAEMMRKRIWAYYKWCFAVVDVLGDTEVNAVASVAACSAATVRRHAALYDAFRDEIYLDVPLNLYRACLRNAGEDEGPTELLREALEKGWGRRDVYKARQVKREDDSWKGRGQIIDIVEDADGINLGPGVVLEDADELGGRLGEQVRVTLRPG